MSDYVDLVVSLANKLTYSTKIAEYLGFTCVRPQSFATLTPYLLGSVSPAGAMQVTRHFQVPDNPYHLVLFDLFTTHKPLTIEEADEIKEMARLATLP